MDSDLEDDPRSNSGHEKEQSLTKGEAIKRKKERKRKRHEKLIQQLDKAKKRKEGQEKVEKERAESVFQVGYEKSMIFCFLRIRSISCATFLDFCQLSRPKPTPTARAAGTR